VHIGKSIVPNGVMMQPPAIAVSSPFNDVQLVALIAATLKANCTESVCVCVTDAQDIVLEAIRQAPRFQKAVRDLHQPPTE